MTAVRAEANSTHERLPWIARRGRSQTVTSISKNPEEVFRKRSSGVEFSGSAKEPVEKHAARKRTSIVSTDSMMMATNSGRSRKSLVLPGELNSNLSSNSSRPGQVIRRKSESVMTQEPGPSSMLDFSGELGDESEDNDDFDAKLDHEGLDMRMRSDTPDMSRGLETQGSKESPNKTAENKKQQNVHKAWMMQHIRQLIKLCSDESTRSHERWSRRTKKLPNVERTAEAVAQANADAKKSAAHLRAQRRMRILERFVVEQDTETSSTNASVMASIGSGMAPTLQAGALSKNMEPDSSSSSSSDEFSDPMGSNMRVRKSTRRHRFKKASANTLRSSGGGGVLPMCIQDARASVGSEAQNEDGERHSHSLRLSIESSHEIEISGRGGSVNMSRFNPRFNKRKFAEVPRLRNKFRDQCQILGGRDVRSKTGKRQQLECAARLGLTAKDYDTRSIYYLSFEELEMLAIRKAEELKRLAAIRIQRGWALCKHAQLVAVRLRSRKEATLRIQKWWRHISRWSLLIKYRILRRPCREKMITIIQAHWRMWRCYKKWERHKILFMLGWRMATLKKDLLQPEHAAARLIHTSIQGYLARLHMVHLREECRQKGVKIEIEQGYDPQQSSTVPTMISPRAGRRHSLAVRVTRATHVVKLASPAIGPYLDCSDSSCSGDHQRRSSEVSCMDPMVEALLATQFQAAREEPHFSILPSLPPLAEVLRSQPMNRETSLMGGLRSCQKLNFTRSRRGPDF